MLVLLLQKGGVGKFRPFDKNMVRRAPSRRDKKHLENGVPKKKRARRSTSDQEEGSNSEEEEKEETMPLEKTKKINGQVEATCTIKQEEEMSEQVGQNKPRPAEKGTALTNGLKVEENEEQNEGRCRVNGEVKKEEVDLKPSGTKPYTESPKPYTEVSAQTSAQTEQVPVTMTTTGSSGGVEQKASVQSESSQPAAEVPPPKPVKREC